MTNAKSPNGREGQTALDEAVKVLLGQPLRECGVGACADRCSRGDRVEPLG